MSVTADDVDGLSYGELQRRCKELGISARGKRDELARRLLELDEVTPNSPPVSSLLRNGSQVSATPVPSTSTRPSSTVTPRRRPAPALSDLAEALSTPLPPPRPPSTAEHDTPAVAGTLSRPPRSGSTLLKLLATFAVLGVLTAVGAPLAEKHGLLRTQDLVDRAHAVWDPLAARAQHAASAARAETEAAVSRAKASAAATWQQGETCVRRHLGGAPAALRHWFVTVPTTYLHRLQAAPASLWRRAAIGQRLGAAQASLRPKLAAIRSAVERHILALKSNVLERVRAARERIAELTAKKEKKTPAVVEDATPEQVATPDETPSPASAQDAVAQEPAATQPPPNCALSMEALSRVVTPSATWQGALEDLREMLVGQKPDARKHQANVITLAYGSEEERVKNFNAFYELAKPNCIAFVDAWSVTEPGELQKRLAEYLRWEPTAIVAVQLIELMSPRVLPVLINAMSEGGGFEYDGFVPSKDATFVLTTRVPHEWLGTPDVHAFEHSTKEAVAYGLQAHPDAAAVEGTPAMLVALRRRIDAVLAAGDLAPVAAPAVADEEDDESSDDESSDEEAEAEVAPEVVEEPTVTMPDSAEEAAAAAEKQGADLGADAELLDLEAVLAEDPEVMERFIAGLESGDSENVLEWDGVASDGAFPGDARSPEEIAQDLGHWDPDDSFKRPGADDLEGLPQAAQ